MNYTCLIYVMYLICYDFMHVWVYIYVCYDCMHAYMYMSETMMMTWYSLWKHAWGTWDDSGKNVMKEYDESMKLSYDMKVII